MALNTTLDRRSFLRSAALGTAAVGLAGAVIDAEKATAEEVEAAVTNYYACQEDWLGMPPEVGEPAQTIEADVLVLGGGHSGIQAALAAAEGGAHVVVVEKWAEDMRIVKGEDIGHINSQWLIDQGYGPYDVGEVTSEFVRRAGGRCNQEIIRKFVANSGEMFDHVWQLADEGWNDPDIKAKIIRRKHPERDGDVSPLDPSQVICQVSGLTADGPVEYPMMCGGNGSYAAVAQFMGTISHDNSVPGCAAMSRLDEVQQFSILKGIELGAEWVYSTRALVLTTDESGAVTGAIGQNVDSGEYIQFVAPKVILCTGDYSGDSKMTWNLNADIAEYNGRQGLTQEDLFSPFADCTGDGQKMACWIGAVMEPTPRAAMNTGGGGGGAWGTCPYLFLDAAGMRYCNEANAVGITAATLGRPAGIVTTVTDAKYYETLKRAGLDHGAPNYGRPDYYTELVEDMEAIELENPEGGSVRACTIAERDGRITYASATLEGALKLAGYEGDALQTALDQVAKYNELCYAGKDSQYGKDAQYMIPVDEPPFYTATSMNSKTTSTGLVTLAGLETTDNLEVVNVAGQVIPGLYAAGNCLGERYGNSYATPFAGNSIGMAMTHGRVAGKIATGQEVL